jgi:hypothetical protein
MKNGRNEEDERTSRCASCGALVFAEIAYSGRTDANSVCALCGLTLADLTHQDADYFDVIMRVGRPLRGGLRFRRPR